jgi:hypothetical protein
LHIVAVVGALGERIYAVADGEWCSAGALAVEESGPSREVGEWFHAGFGYLYPGLEWT